MSQAKVDQRKQEKYNRMHPKKSSSFKKFIPYIAIGIVVIAFIVWVGFSIDREVNPEKYTTTATPESTTYVKKSQKEIESLREALIKNGDTNVAVENKTTKAKDKKSKKK